jgi:stalled ribosome rescue protein Dom34
MSFHQAVVWVDQAEAHVMHLNPSSEKQLVIHSQHRKDQLAHKKLAAGKQQQREEQSFYEQISLAISGMSEILIIGPNGAKDELINHMKHCNPALADRILHVEAMEQRSDDAILEFARKFFRDDDREVDGQNNYG